MLIGTLTVWRASLHADVAVGAELHLDGLLSRPHADVERAAAVGHRWMGRGGATVFKREAAAITQGELETVRSPWRRWRMQLHGCRYCWHGGNRNCRVVHWCRRLNRPALHHGDSASSLRRSSSCRPDAENAQACICLVDEAHVGIGANGQLLARLGQDVDQEGAPVDVELLAQDVGFGLERQVTHVNAVRALGCRRVANRAALARSAGAKGCSTRIEARRACLIIAGFSNLSRPLYF